MASKVENAVFPTTGFEVRFDNDLSRSLWLQIGVKDCDEFYNPLDIMPVIMERIESGKKPAGVLAKEVGRIAHHVEQLNDALSTLLTTYHRMVSVTPKKLSVAYRARYAVLNSMKPKMLKDYAKDYIPDEVDNFILSDESDKEALIRRLCEVMVEERDMGEVRTAVVE